MQTTHNRVRIPSRTLAQIALLVVAAAALLAARAAAQYGPLLYDSVVYGAGGTPVSIVTLMSAR